MKCLIYFLVLLTQEEELLQYESQNQAFSFHKQVWFKDNNSNTELRPDVKSGGGRSTQTLPIITPRLSDISTIPHVH